MGFRISRKGYKFIFNKELIVYHHPTTIKELAKKWFVFGKSYPLSYLKHKTMRSMEFYARLLYLPLLCVLIALSLIWGE